VVAGDAHAARLGSDGAWELPLRHSAFQQESYGGRPQLPRPPAVEYLRAGIPVPKRWACFGVRRVAYSAIDC